jgi:phage/plasmid-like protein (TIGR03299 family)
MRSLLDDVLDATVARSGAVVVSEQHDVSQIDWQAAQMDVREMVKGGRNVVQAAIARAKLDTSTGKVAVMVAGQPAWHKLGVNVAGAVSAADAIRLASLDWDVEKRRLYFLKADGTYRVSDDAFGIVRADTEEQLGTVGTRYRAIQNREGFDFLDSVIDEFGAKYHTAGAIHNGAKVWMQCELPEHGFEAVRGDEVQAFATFTNPHDGSGKAWCFPTTNRIVCANTFRTASTDRTNGLGIRHTGDVRSSINDAWTALGFAVREIDQFKDAAEEMVRTPVDAPAFFSDLLDAVLDITAADMRKGADILAAAVAKTSAQQELEAKRIQRQIDQRRDVLADILDRYDSGKNGIGGIRGTAWSAFNAVTEHADHTVPKRMVGTEAARLSRRFESAINGDGDELKQTAFRMLTGRN